MNRYPLPNRTIRVDPKAWIAPTAALIGDVDIAEDASIWFGAVLRGDINAIRIGARTSIQDNAVIHTSTGLGMSIVGHDCTVGHSAILHGCSVGDRVLVGMGSIVLDNAEVASDVVIGAGSLIPMNAKIPSGVLVFGRPAKVVRELSPEERAMLLEAASRYVELAAGY